MNKKLFLPFQSKWIMDKSRWKIAEKSRQIGWTWSQGYNLVRRIAIKGAPNDAWISSRDILQAKLFIEDCKGWAKLLQYAAQDLGEVVMDVEGRKISAYVLEFANGRRIYSLSSNPDGQAGKRGDRTLDEFALNKDNRQLYAICQPGLTWGGSLEIFSTHRGTANYFNQLILEARHKGNPKGFSVHRVTLQDALDQGFLQKLQSKLPKDDPIQDFDEADYFDFTRRQAPDEETFLQEFMCVPSDDESAFLSYELIDGCKYAPTENWEKTVVELGRLGELYVGVDIGRKRDLTVIWVLEKTGGMFFTRKVIVLEKQPFRIQEGIFYGIMDLPQVKRCCIDNTGIGMQFAERAAEKYGTYRAEEITFNNSVKEQLAYPMRAAFEDKTIRVPDEKKIIADFRSIKKETTAAGNIRFTADHGDDGHADRFWACALALHAGKNPGGCPPEAMNLRKRLRAFDLRERRIAL